MWLVAHDRRWMADRLARRGLPHPERCPHCDQAEESINHLLLSCVFAGDFWFRLFHRVGLQILAPRIGEELFDDWWEKIILPVGALEDNCIKASTPLWFLGLGPFGITTIDVFLMVYLLVWLEPHCLPVRRYSCAVWLGLKVFFYLFTQSSQ